MREAAKHKRLRFRKAGGADVYIEERYLERIRQNLGENVEYATFEVKGRNSLILRFPTQGTTEINALLAIIFLASIKSKEDR